MRIERLTVGFAIVGGHRNRRKCPDCHALATALEAHKKWHSRLVHDIATAVDREVTRRVEAR